MGARFARLRHRGRRGTDRREGREARRRRDRRPDAHVAPGRARRRRLRPAARRALHATAAGGGATGGAVPAAAGSATPPWPPAMQLLARRVRDRQEAAVELYRRSTSAPWTEVVTDFELCADPLAESAGTLLSVRVRRADELARPVWLHATAQLDDAVEKPWRARHAGRDDAGRADARLRRDAPAGAGDRRQHAGRRRARAFTIIHELGHLYLAALGEPVGPETEPWCDEFAGEVLDAAGLDGERPGRPTRPPPRSTRSTQLALRFGRRRTRPRCGSRRPGSGTQDVVDDVIEEIRSREPRERGAGGDYYRTQIGRLRPAFVRLVFNAL